MPYDFTACLGHIDITYTISSLQIIRIAGVLEHNEGCQKRLMKRLPPIPLHPHVWQVALEQVNNGASIDALQKRNQELYQARLYHGQCQYKPDTANHRYILLKSDLHSLYRKQAAYFGINILRAPEHNVDSWMDPESPDFHKDIASAVFYYRARTTAAERLRICIQTSEMRDATWKYSHKKQMVLDGTFGICDHRLLLFIALGVDENFKGIPLAFFLFSAPQGNQATHAGYDTDILYELLAEWVQAMGCLNGESFKPLVVITDTDLKERGALLKIWPDVLLLLCKFHLRQCWTNQRKALIKSPKTPEFSRQQIQARLRKLEIDLIETTKFMDALNLIEEVRAWLKDFPHPSGGPPIPIVAAEKYITYLVRYWLSEELWQSWSAFGRTEASKITQIPLEGILPTTNHLEAFNGVLKRKYIQRYQRNGRRIHFDLLVALLATRIIPSIFQQRQMEREYYTWLSSRFTKETGGINLVKSSRPGSSSIHSSPSVTWWVRESDLKTETVCEIKAIVGKGRIGNIQWINPFTLHATCASSLAHINQENHRRFDLKLTCYGFGYCSCPFNQGGKGACKHLWALRTILPQLHPQFIFYFPPTQAEALKVHEYYQSAESKQHENSNAITPPPDELSKVAVQVNFLIEGAQPEFIENDGSENQDEGGFESPDESDTSLSSDVDNNATPLLPPFVSNPGSSGIAFRQQQLNHLEQSISSLLPRLHGLHLSLKDITDIPGGGGMTIATQVTELDTVVGNIQAETSRLLLENVPSNRPELPFSSRGPTKHTILPPSPERAQRRKKSHATY